MTRAKEELYLTYATSRALFVSVQHNPPSQFITDSTGGFNKPAVRFDTVFPMTKTPQPNGNEPRYTNDLNEGDAVRHNVFGVGIVLQIEGDVVAVNFKNKGIKKLNVAFAPLDKIVDYES